MTNTASLPTAEKPRRGCSRTDVHLPEAVPAATPTKLDQIVAMLTRAEGASLAELVTATGWQGHSVRGALAGSLKRKGHTVLSEKTDGERRYRLGAEQ